MWSPLRAHYVYTFFESLREFATEASHTLSVPEAVGEDAKGEAKPS